MTPAVIKRSLLIVYQAACPREGRDLAIAAALGDFATGAGYAFDTSERDFTARVPEAALPEVLRKLRLIEGISIKIREGRQWMDVDDAWQSAVILRNVAADPQYAPYCMRCPGLRRMQIVEHLYWTCPCGAECDYRDGELS